MYKFPFSDYNTIQYNTIQSVIDYVLIAEEHSNLIKYMEIDEEREKTPYRDDTRYKEKKYTDHNMITIYMNMDIKMKQNEEQIKIKVNEETMEKFKEMTNNGQLTAIWEDKQLTTQEKYTKWNNQVIGVARSISIREVKKNGELKEIKILREQRKRLKSNMQTEKNEKKRNIIKERRQMIKDHYDTDK